jgi:hypothetical protein
LLTIAQGSGGGAKKDFQALAYPSVRSDWMNSGKKMNGSKFRISCHSDVKLLSLPDIGLGVT